MHCFHILTPRQIQSKLNEVEEDALQEGHGISNRNVLECLYPRILNKGNTKCMQNHQLYTIEPYLQLKTPLGKVFVDIRDVEDHVLIKLDQLKLLPMDVDGRLVCVDIGSPPCPIGASLCKDIDHLINIDTSLSS